MSNHELAHARAELHASGATWALLTSAENVTYVSHYEVPVEFGPLAHLNYGPVTALIGVEEATTLLVANQHYADAARKQSSFDAIIGFGILEVFAPFAKQVGRDNYITALRQALQQSGIGQQHTKVAVEERTLPLVALQVIQEELPNVELIEAGPALARARMVKTGYEVERLKQVAETVNIAHQACQPWSGRR